MTQTQVAYLNLLEQQRHNRETEDVSRMQAEASKEQARASTRSSYASRTSAEAAKTSANAKVLGTITQAGTTVGAGIGAAAGKGAASAAAGGGAGVAIGLAAYGLSAAEKKVAEDNLTYIAHEYDVTPDSVLSALKSTTKQRYKVKELILNRSAAQRMYVRVKGGK